MGKCIKCGKKAGFLKSECDLCKNTLKSLFYKNGRAVYDYSKEYLTNPTKLVAGNEHTGIIEKIDDEKAMVTIVIASEEKPQIAYKLDFQKEVWHTLKEGDAVIYVPITVVEWFALSGVISAKLTNEYILPNVGWKTEWAFDVSPLLSI